MAVRRESVRLSLEDAGYSTGMARATASTLMLDRALEMLDGSNVRVQESTDNTGKEVDRLSDAAVRGSASIDQYSGRLRILAEAITLLGPGILAIGAGGVTALAGISGLLGAAAVGGVALLGAVQGVGDALKAVEKARLDPTVENLAAAEELVSRLAPEAQKFVDRFQEIRPILKALRDAGAEELFPGLTDALGSLEKLAPTLRELMAASGEAGGAAIASSAESLASDRWEPFLMFLTDEIPDAVDNTTHLLGSLSHAAAEMWRTFDPTNDRFIDWLVDAADAFDDWASSSEGRQDIRDFLAYAEENGPKIADMFAAIADAVTQVAQAAGPLSGSALTTLTGVSNAIAAIADSDLGTPILTGLAALTLYTRGLKVATALQSRLFGTANGLSSPAAFAQVRRAGADLNAVGQQWRYLGASAAFAEARQSRAIAGMAKGAAVIGGLALATTGAADSVGLTNAASLALMGTLAGPWGAAVGGAVGLALDVASANNEWAASMSRVDDVIAAGNVEDMTRQLGDLRERLRDMQNVTGVGDFVSDGLSGLGDTFSRFGSLITGEYVAPGAARTVGAIEELEDAIAGAQDTSNRARLAQMGLSDALVRTGEDAVGTSGDLILLADSTQKSSDAAWSAFDAQTRLGASMDAVADAARKGKRGIDASTESGRENRTALTGLAGDWASAKAAMEANGASARSVERRYREVRNRLISAATAMGASRTAAVRLADQLAKPMSIVIKERHQEAISSAKAAIAELRRAIEGNPITQRVVTVNVGGKPTKATVGTPGGVGDLIGGGRAYGGYTGAGGKFEPAGIVHRGEVVIPQEDVARDRDFLRDRYGHLPGMDQLWTGGLAGYAGGGRVGSVGALGFAGLPALDLASMSAKELAEALQESRSALKRETSQRQSLVDRITETKSAVTSNLRSDPFANASTLEEALGIITGDIARTKAFNADRAEIVGKGLRGGALSGLLTSGNEALLEDAAGSSKAELARLRVQFARWRRVTAAAGASAGSAVGLGVDIASNAEIRRLSKRVDRLAAILTREHEKDRRATRRGASQAAQRKHRGYLG